MLAETDLTFGKALELAQALEAAKRNAKDLTPHSVVHTVRRQACSNGTNRSSFSPSYRCGGEHLSTVCKFKDADCRNCGKKGHIARVCCSKPKQGTRSAPRRWHANTLHVLETAETASDTAYTRLTLPIRFSLHQEDRPSQ